MVLCLSGEIGRRTGLKILRESNPVPVQVRPQAPFLLVTKQLEKYPSLVEGTGLENREVGDGAGVRIPLSPPLVFYIAEQSSLVARWAHNPKVVGSNPASATNVVPGCSGYHVCLSRRRSRVRISSGPPFMALQLSRQSRGLKILVSVVQFRPKPPFNCRYCVRSQINWIDRLTTDQKVMGSTPIGRATYSGNSTTWQCTTFGMQGLQVQILFSRPFNI